MLHCVTKQTAKRIPLIAPELKQEGRMLFDLRSEHARATQNTHFPEQSSDDLESTVESDSEVTPFW